MPDPSPTQTPPPPAPPSPPAAPPLEVEVPFHGQTRKVPLAEAQKLIGIALQDEHRRGEVQKLQSQLKEQAQAQAAKLRVADALEALTQRNPQAARAIDGVYTALTEGRLTPEQVLASLQTPGGSNGTETPPPTSGTQDPRTLAVLQDLQTKLQNVEAKVQTREQADSLRDRNQEIAAALAADPSLRDRPAVQGIVRTLLEPHLAQGLSIQEAVALAAQAYRGALQEDQTTERDRLLGVQRLATVSPSAGMPALAAPDFSRIDPKLPIAEQSRLRLKAIGEAARTRLKMFGQQALAGPRSP